MPVYKINKTNGNLEDNPIAGGTLWADMPIGAEVKFSGQYIPLGFHVSDGSSYDTSKYTELYRQLGTSTLPNNQGFIIKMINMPVPADFMNEVGESMESEILAQTHNVVTDGDLNPVSGNAVYDSEQLLQPKILATPITVGGTQQTTVEGALGGLNSKKWDYKIFPQDTDLNNITANGSYNVSFSTNYEVVHFPVADWGVLVVTNSVENVQQVFHSVGIAGAIYVRNKVSGTWSSWQKLVTATDLADVGTVYSVSNSRPSGGWTVPETGKQSTSISITCPRGIYLYQVYMEGDGSSILPSSGWVYAYGHCNSAQAGGGWQGIRFPVSTLLAENFTEDLYFSAWNPKKVAVTLTLLKKL